MKIASKALCAFLIFIPWMATAKDLTLYDRVDARLKHDPGLAKVVGHPAKEMSSVAWMIGTWDIATSVEAVPGRAVEKGTSKVAPVLGGAWLEVRDTYPQGNQDISYLGFNPVTKRWVTMTVDGVGNAVTNSAPQWNGSKLAFVGDVVVIGEKATLRQIITKINDHAYTVTNEEKMPDGHWQLLDTYRYTKRTN
jgi:hypothetical protein